MLSIICLCVGAMSGTISFDTQLIKETEDQIMKKNYLIKTIIPAFAAAVMLTACAGDENVHSEITPGDQTDTQGQTGTIADPVATGEGVTIFDYDMTEYVALGDYLHMDIDFEPTEITEDIVDSRYLNFLSDYAEAVDSSLYETERAVRDGDLISLDFCGKKDGVAFEGGTAQGYILDIGSGTFIPGFEEGLIGVMPGEEVDLNLTFPENYGSADLAGQDVVFTCTVQGIITIDSIIETANQNLDPDQEIIKDEEELRGLCRTELIRQAAEYDRSNLEVAIIDAIPEIVTEKQPFPEELKTSYDQLMMQTLNSIAASYGVDAETLVAYYGLTIEDYVGMYSADQLKSDAAFYVIAAENGLLPDDAEYEKLFEEYMEEYGIVDKSELFTNYTENQYKGFLLNDKVLDFLCEQYMK